MFWLSEMCVPASGNNEIKLCGEGDLQISAGSRSGSTREPLMFATVAQFGGRNRIPIFVLLCGRPRGLSARRRWFLMWTFKRVPSEGVALLNLASFN